MIKYILNIEYVAGFWEPYVEHELVAGGGPGYTYDEVFMQGISKDLQIKIRAKQAENINEWKSSVKFDEIHDKHCSDILSNISPEDSMIMKTATSACKWFEALRILKSHYFNA